MKWGTQSVVYCVVSFGEFLKPVFKLQATNSYVLELRENNEVQQKER